MSGRSIGQCISNLGYHQPKDFEDMPIEDLIMHLKSMQNENPTATCSIGVNPKCLLVKMGCRMVMLKLDGDW